MALPYKLGSVKVGYGFLRFSIISVAIGGDPLINTVMVLGGATCMRHLRAQLTPVTVTAVSAL